MITFLEYIVTMSAKIVISNIYIYWIIYCIVITELYYIHHNITVYK